MAVVLFVFSFDVFFFLRLFSFASYNKRNTQQCTTARQTAPGQGFWIPTLLSSLFSGIKRLPQTIPHTQRGARSAITSTRFKIQHTPWTWFLLAFSHLRTYDLDDGYTHHTTKIWGDDHYYERRLAYGLKLRLTTISTWNGQTNLFVWRIVLRRQLRSPDWTPRGRWHASGFGGKACQAGDKRQCREYCESKAKKRHWLSMTVETGASAHPSQDGAGRDREVEAKWRFIRHIRAGHSIHCWAGIANVAGPLLADNAWHTRPTTKPRDISSAMVTIAEESIDTFLLPASSGRRMESKLL